MASDRLPMPLKYPWKAIRRDTEWVIESEPFTGETHSMNATGACEGMRVILASGSVFLGWASHDLYSSWGVAAAHGIVLK
jgi:hypothetical protein